MLQVGTVLHGTYKIESYLASGGFGNTYFAKNIEFDETYAIKEFFVKGVCQRDGNSTTISVSNAENTNSFEQQREKFKKEARRLRSLSNPHIVKVYDLFEENGTAYYVMDYVDGENLSARLKRTNAPLTESAVLNYLNQILDGLEAIHNEGMFHLDIKPANIMVDSHDIVKLIDFGASKQLSTVGGATMSTGISYTNGYAPSEQMAQSYDKFGPWTDFYALGATMYKLLTNQDPPSVSDLSEDETEDKHLALPMPNVSEEMKKLVVWMMQVNRLKRPKSVGEIKGVVVKAYIVNEEETVSVSTGNLKTIERKSETENNELDESKKLEIVGDKRNQFAPFSSKGRIGRLHYILVVSTTWFIFFTALFLVVVYAEAKELDYEIVGKEMSMFFAGLLGLVSAVSFTQATRRCHDLGYTGWYQFIPFYGFVILFKEGQKKDNKYGKWSSDKLTKSEKKKRQYIYIVFIIVIVGIWAFVFGTSNPKSGMIDDSVDGVELEDSAVVDTCVVDSAALLYYLYKNTDMKKFFTMLVGLQLLMLFVGCDSLSPSERLLVGKWYVQREDTVEGTEVMQELNEVFKDDKTCEAKAISRYKMKDEELDFYTVVTLEYSLKGNWEIKDKLFTEKFNHVEVSVRDVDFEGADVTSNLAQLKEAKESTKKTAYYEMAVPLKKALLGDVGAVKIKKLNEEQFVVVNNENSVVEYKRVAD